MTDEQPVAGQPSPAALQHSTVALTIEELSLLTAGSRTDPTGLPPRSVKHGTKKKQQNKVNHRTQQPSIEDVPAQLEDSEPPALTVPQRIAKEVNRVFATAVGVVFFLAMLFWAKFAYVYNIPDFMIQDASVEGAAGYICYKPWWFGSPLFSLQQILKDNGGQNDRTSLENILHDDKEIIDHPAVLWRYYRK